MILSLGTFAVIAHVYKDQAFLARLFQAGETTGLLLPETIVQVFDEVNDEGTLLALAISTVVVTALSFVVSCSIIHPLRIIEKSIRQFNSGHANVRIPPNSIAELNHLGLTLNSAANRLQDVEQRRQEMIGDLSHELGTPLTVIRGYLEMLKEGRITLTPAIQEELYQESERMNRLLSDLKVLSKTEAGSLPLRLQEFEPLPVIQEVIAALTLSKQNPNCDVMLEEPLALPKVFADPDRVKQVLMNLLSNAIRYTPNGNVTIKAWATRNRLWVSVSDTGIGIAPEVVPHIFERFWRSQESQELDSEGSGIGLAISKRLVEAQGGWIEVESAANEGSTFRFTLPLSHSRQG